MIGDNNLDEDVGRSDTKEDNNLELAITDVTNNRWKKCAALKESETDITTQEEFYKFDFQVNSKRQIPLQFNFDLFIYIYLATMLPFSSNCA